MKQFKDYLLKRLYYGENWYVLWNNEVWATTDIIKGTYQGDTTFDNLYEAIENEYQPITKGQRLQLSNKEQYNLCLRYLGKK